MRVRGWSIDPDALDPVRIHIYVDNVLQEKLTADVAKVSLAEIYRPFGAEHAFTTAIVGQDAGPANVCIFAINVAEGSQSLQCRTITIG